MLVFLLLSANPDSLTSTQSTTSDIAYVFFQWLLCDRKIVFDLITFYYIFYLI